MNKIKNLIKEALLNHKHDCGCGCHGKCAKAPMLNENLGAKVIMTENMQYHIDNKKSLTENTFRYGSKAFLDLWAEARYLYSRDAINLSGEDKIIVETTHLGEYGLFEGEMVPLDLPIMEEEKVKENTSGGTLDEAKEGKHVLNKPHRGGSKKFYVYVRNPKTKKIKKVSFGDTSGLSAKINNPEARRAFSKRHDCPNKTDKTKASYWSCRLPRYAKALGLKSNFTGFW